MLARNGLAAIWILHLSAARQYREGNKTAALAIIEVADAAERELLRRGYLPFQNPKSVPVKTGRGPQGSVGRLSPLRSRISGSLLHRAGGALRARYMRRDHSPIPGGYQNLLGDHAAFPMREGTYCTTL